MIDIWIIDDDARYLNMISDILNRISDIKCTAAFKDLESVLNFLKENETFDRPDVVLLDHQLPGMNGVDGLPRLRRYLNVPILILTNEDDTDLIYSALRMGASGFLFKDVPLDELIAAIRAGQQGGTLLPAAVARKVLDFFVEAVPPADYDLTPREMEVLEMMAHGSHAQEIAEMLEISYYTVNNHMRHIYEKLHVGSDMQAVAKAWKEGLIPRIRNWLQRGR